MNNEIIETGNDMTPQVSEMGAGEMATVAREQAEVQAAFIAAKKWPRNELEAFARASKAVERPGLAEKANYSFPRGSKDVSGPSVYLGRELARIWGNLQSGHRMVSIDDDYVHLVGYCIDLETNTRFEVQDRFERLVQRKVGEGRNRKTQWVKPDERDLRELINKRGAIAMRNAILQVLPADLIDGCCERAKRTVKEGAKTGFKSNREKTTKDLVLAFEELSITVEMIETYLGHSLSVLSEDEYVKLRGVWKSISDGVAKREEFFELEVVAAGPSKAEETLAGLKK